MTLHRCTIALRRHLRNSRLAQFLVLLSFWLAGEAIARVSRLPVPGAVLGMFLVLLLLGSKRLSVLTLRQGARWLLGEMLLFFVPAVLALLDHPEFMGPLGLKILAVIVFGTVTVMVVTALFIELCYRWRVARMEVTR